MKELEKKLWADDIDFITKLTKENKELQAKIDKAIEFLEEDSKTNKDTYTCEEVFVWYWVKELLDILKS